MAAYSKERFLETIKDHQIKIIKDTGVYRHIVMSDGTFNRRYEIVTFPQYLCYVGDMGSYVFSRDKDMFTFFRRDQLEINSGYWHEKLQSVDRNSGSLEYSDELFEQALRHSFEIFVESESGDDWLEGDPYPEDKQKIWDAIRDEVLTAGDDGEVRAYDAATNFKTGGFEFTDFWETNLKEYTQKYIWCLYAIVHAIQQYDKTKQG